jgi:hypothetical protein
MLQRYILYNKVTLRFGTKILRFGTNCFQNETRLRKIRAKINGTRDNTHKYEYLFGI